MMNLFWRTAGCPGRLTTPLCRLGKMSVLISNFGNAQIICLEPLEWAWPLWCDGLNNRPVDPGFIQTLLTAKHIMDFGRTFVWIVKLLWLMFPLHRFKDIVLYATARVGQGQNLGIAWPPPEQRIHKPISCSDGEFKISILRHTYKFEPSSPLC